MTNEQIGEIIAKRRQAKGLSVRALGAASDVPYQTITKLEHGKHNPRLETLSRLFSALDLKMVIK